MLDKKEERRRVLDLISGNLMDVSRNDTWLEKNQPVLLRELKLYGKIDPTNIFTIHDSQEYITLKERVPNEEEYEDGGNTFREPKQTTTGYLKPYFRFTINDVGADDYENTLRILGLMGKSEVSPEKIPAVESFSNLLESQYDRQTAAIAKSHRAIADKLGILYSEAEQSIFRTNLNSDKIAKADQLPDELVDLVLHLRSIFNRIQRSSTLIELKSTHPFQMLISNGYVESDRVMEVADQIFKFYERRHSYIETLKRLTRKILSLESIKNDIIFNGELKTVTMVRREEAYRDMPDPSTFAKILTGKNKNPKTSDINMTTRALIQLRKYLLDEEITDLSGEVENIHKELIKRTKDLTATKNTIRKWIKRYFAKYQENRRKRLSNR